jgi:hypothetical protein
MDKVDPTVIYGLCARGEVIRFGNYFLLKISNLLILSSQSRNILMPRNAIVIPRPKRTNLISSSFMLNQLLVRKELFIFYRPLFHNQIEK